MVLSFSTDCMLLRVRDALSQMTMANPILTKATAGTRNFVFILTRFINMLRGKRNIVAEFLRHSV